MICFLFGRFSRKQELVSQLASKKGIAITAAIVAGVVATSMLIWLQPQTQTVTNITDSELASQDVANMPANNISFVYNEHDLITTEIESAYEKWTTGDISSNELKAGIDRVRLDAAQLKNRLTAGQPPEEWRQSYSLYAQALEKFDAYLKEMEAIVNSENRDPAPARLAEIKQEMDSLAEQAVDAFPK